MINITNEDNMLLMARYPDNYFDLAIVDPPYGIGEDGRKSKGRTTRKDGSVRNGIDSRNGATIFRKAADYSIKEWDSKPPTIEYFNELKRVSKNQIIFGANHFIQTMGAAGYYTNSSCWIVWNKLNGENSFADCELAWTSFKTAVRKFDFQWQGMLQGDMKNKEVRIHPTQKPVKLYEWLLHNYAKEGYKILDTHLGSCSIAIACHNLKFDLTACELDKEYYEASLKRLHNHQSQLTMF
jgi:site-specific DNA-methyltransferase (adenine-specific)